MPLYFEAVLSDLLQRLLKRGGPQRLDREPERGPRAQTSLTEHLRLGLASQQRGDHASAVRAYRSVLDEQPDNPTALHLLGHMLTLTGRSEEAVALLSRAAALMPEDADVSFNLADALRREGQLAAAEGAFQRAVALRPTFAVAWLNLAGIMTDSHRLDDAEECYQRALESSPDLAEAHYNYGNLLHREGRVAEALSRYREAVRLKPDFVRAHSNLVFTLNYSDEASPEEIFDEHREWARRHADPLGAEVRPHLNPRTGGRPLRVGYVSPDFRDHAVTYFFESTLAHHDPRRVAAYCYSDVERADVYTERLRRSAYAWRDIVGQDDESIAELVRSDEIDILVDLTGHTDNHRLLMFARKPAPVQVTWNGYPNTTGMRAMDYRITDLRADPPGISEHLYSETLVRLPDVYMVFTPPATSPGPSPTPYLKNGHITLGSFNALFKVTPRAIRVWSDLLHTLPKSRLLMFTVPAGRTRDRVVGAFAAHGIDEGRLDLMPRLPFMEFLKAYSRVDIALDSFPYNGTTTTCQTLWMGVPVVTIAGKSLVSRVGVTMLTSVGLEKCVAEDEEDYIRRTIALASNPARLQELRGGLRARMASSPLVDGARFARALEDAYAKMWEDYCRRSRAVEE